MRLWGGFWVAQPANNHTLHDKDSMPRAQAGTWACSTAWWSAVGAAGTEVCRRLDMLWHKHASRWVFVLTAGT